MVFGNRMEGSASSLNLSTAALTDEFKCLRRRGVVGGEGFVVDGVEKEDELDFRGEKWVAGESSALEAKRTRCSRSVIAAPSGSIEGERGKRAPGIVTDGSRFRAGCNGGDGERCERSPSEPAELTIGMNECRE